MCNNNFDKVNKWVIELSVIVIRTIFLYALIVFGLRIMGKRQLGELQPSELVSTIIISNIATLPIEDINMPFMAGVMPILTLICFEVFMSLLTLKSISARKIISGTPRTIIRDGIIDQTELKNLRFSVDDLMAQLRFAGVFDIRDVAFAIVETTGKLSIYEKYSARTVTAEMMNLPVKTCDNAPPTVLIGDGIINYNALNYCNLSEDWLKRILKEHNCEASDVFLMSCDRTADYHIVLKEKVGKKNWKE